MRCSSSMRSVDDARCSLKRRSSIRSSQTVSFPKKMQSMKCSNFREYGATALLGLPLPLEYVGANVMVDSHSRRYVRHTSAQATYRRCLPWAAAVRRESSVASNERVRDSILLTRHLLS